jgi:hypothetical protein
MKNAIIYSYYCTNFTIEGELYRAVAYKANKPFNKFRK